MQLTQFQSCTRWDSEERSSACASRYPFDNDESTQNVRTLCDLEILVHRFQDKELLVCIFSYMQNKRKVTNKKKGILKNICSIS